MRKIHIHPGMISAQPSDDIVFRRVDRFVYAINVPNPAEYVYSVSDKYDPRGFAGRPIDFKMEDGSTYTSRGTWHCAASYLPKDVYEEIKDKYYTHCVISHTPIKYENYGGTIIIENEDDIIFMDESWVIGAFDRGEKLAVEYAHKLGKDVYYKSMNTGGGCSFHTELYDLKRNLK
jgi:hypothetical protein